MIGLHDRQPAHRAHHKGAVWTVSVVLPPEGDLSKPGPLTIYDGRGHVIEVVDAAVWRARVGGPVLCVMHGHPRCFVCPSVTRARERAAQAARGRRRRAVA